MSAHMPAPPPTSGGWAQPLRPPPPPSTSSAGAAAAVPFQHPHSAAAAAAGDFAPQPQVAMYNPAIAAPVNNGPLLEQPGASDTTAQDTTGAYYQHQQPHDPSQGHQDEQQALRGQYEPQAQGYDNQQYESQAYADYYAQQQQQGDHTQQQQQGDQQTAYDYYQHQNYYDQSGYYWEQQNQQQPYEEVAQRQDEHEPAVGNTGANEVGTFEGGASGGGEITVGQQPAAVYFDPHENPAAAAFGTEEDIQVPGEEAIGEPEKYPERERRAPSIGGALETPPVAVGQEVPPLPLPLVPPVPPMVSSGGPSMPDVARDLSTKQAPDILLLPSNQFVPPPSSDRNLFMQTGELNANDEQAVVAAAAAAAVAVTPSLGATGAPPAMMANSQPPPPLLQPPLDQVREPVDGGNEEVDDGSAAAAVVGAPIDVDRDEDDATDLDIPMDRLVLGENLPPPPPPPPPPPAQERVVPGEPLIQHPPQPQNLLVLAPPMASSSPVAVRPPAAQQSLTPILQPPPASSHQPGLRSETVGSDRRDESVMGPTQDTGPTAIKREEGTGAAADANANAPSVAAAAVERPFDGRDEESDGDRSRTSSNRQHNQKRGNKERERENGGGRSGTHNRRRSCSSDGDISSSEHDRQQQRQDYRRSGSPPPPQRRIGDRGSDERRSTRRERRDRYYDDSRYHDRYHDERRGHRGDARYERDRTSRDDRSYRDEKSLRDDRSYYDESTMGQSFRRYGGGRNHDDRYDRREESRSSSRAGSVYDGYHGRGAGGGPGYSYARDYVMQHQYYPQPQPPYPTASTMLPDRAAMDVFEKHWRHYLRNPHLYEQLRTGNPAQYESLNNYYKMCGEYLKLPTIPHVAAPPAPTNLVPKDNERPSSRASVHSGQSSAPPPPSSALESTDRQQPQQNLDEHEPNADSEFEMLGYTPATEEELQNVSRMTPAKFGSAHVKGVFGIIGNFARVDGKNPLLDGQSASVSMHSLQTMLSELPEAKEMATFPGPLIPGKTHKGEVIQFCQSKIASSASNDIVDIDSYNLIWELLILLLRQKNAIDGSDIAELLLHKREDVHRPYAKKMSVVEEAEDEVADADEQLVVKNDRTVVAESGDVEKVTAKFRDYLLYGHKREALEFAMKRGLWGHALFLASKMDDRSYSSVMLRFANGLAANDPLQTLYQLMSGRQPVAVKECADKNWGDWRPHLAMILSNRSAREELDHKSITQLGDTLSEKGMLHAAHFCHLMANAQFGSRMDTGVKLVLIGADHRRTDLSYDAFATTESIQCTEIFEYVQRLSDPEHAMMPFQHFKFLYAIRLLDHGMASSALDYFEQIASCLVKRSSEVTASELMDPASFASQLLILCDRLKYLDPSYATRDGEVSEMADPEWLEGFKNAAHTIGYYDYSYQYENYDHANYDPQQAAEGDGHGGNQDHQAESAEIPDQNGQVSGQIRLPAESAPPSIMNAIPEEGQGTISPTKGGESPSTATSPPPMFQPGNMPSTSSMPPPSLPPLAMGTTSPPVLRQNSVDSTSSSQHQSPKRATPSETGDGSYFAGIQRKDSALMQQPHPSRPPVMKPSSQTVPPTNPAMPNAGSSASQVKVKKKNEPKKEGGPGLFGRIIGKFMPGNQAHLPKDTDNSIVWDEVNKRWIDKNADPDDDANGANVAPPSDMELSRTNSSADMAALAQQPAPHPPGIGNTLAPPPGAGNNKFAGGLGKRRGASGRIDVFKQSQSSPSLVSTAAAAAPPQPPAPALIPPPGPMMTPMSVPPQEEGGAAEADHDKGNGPISMSAAPTTTASDLHGASDAAPQFFNPNQFAGNAPVGATKRNKYH